MGNEVKVLSDRAMKYGAPKEEAFCLAVSRMCCEQCTERPIRGGNCGGIWKHKDWIDYEKFCCQEFVKKQI